MTSTAPKPTDNGYAVRALPGGGYSFHTPLPPSTNQLWRKWRGRMVLNPVARDFKQQVALHSLAMGVKPLSGDVVLTIIVYPPDKRRADISNRVKCLEDALIGCAYHDDEQVSDLIVRRRYAKGKRGCVVMVEKAKGMGCQ
jgi:crossover junction endodeoxyribonuclease RusA